MYPIGQLETGNAWQLLLALDGNEALYESMRRRGDVIHRLSELFRRRLDTLSLPLSARFVSRHRSLFNPEKPLFESRAVEWLSHMSQLLKFQDATVLDVGCGYGLHSLYAYLGGARRVVGIDRSSPKINDMRRMVSYSSAEGVVGLCGDYRTLLKSGAKFNIIMCTCFLSHLPNNDGFVKACSEMLLPGGKVYLMDDNNWWSPLRQLTVRADWIKAEYFGAPPHTKSIRAIRRDIIRQRLSERGYSEPVRLLIQEFAVFKTQGFTKEQILKYMSQLFKGGHKDTYKVDFRYTYPVTSVCEERLLDPLGLSKQFLKLGYKVTLFPGTKGEVEVTAGPDNIKYRTRTLLRFLLPEFELLAEKRGVASKH